MRRILPFLLIPFLISCSNQQTESSATTEQDENQVLSIKEVETDNEVKANIDEENPDAVTIQIPSEDAKNNGGSEISFMFQKGTTAYSNDDFEAGVVLFKQIVEKDPENRKAYYNLGVGYFELDKFSNALQAFNKAIELSPNDSLSIQHRGRVYYMLGDFQKCLKDYERVIEMKPEDPVAWYNRGTAKGQLKDYLGALQDFDRAIELDPEYAEAYFNRGLANFFQQRRHEACYDWRKAHSLGHYEADKALRSYCEGDGGDK